jgi:hypothetical protein
MFSAAIEAMFTMSPEARSFICGTTRFTRFSV